MNPEAEVFTKEHSLIARPGSVADENSSNLTLSEPINDYINRIPGRVHSTGLLDGCTVRCLKTSLAVPQKGYDGKFFHSSVYSTHPVRVRRTIYPSCPPQYGPRNLKFATLLKLPHEANFKDSFETQKMSVRHESPSTILTMIVRGGRVFPCIKLRCVHLFTAS